MAELEDPVITEEGILTRITNKLKEALTGSPFYRAFTFIQGKTTENQINYTRDTVMMKFLQNLIVYQ